MGLNAYCTLQFAKINEITGFTSHLEFSQRGRNFKISQNFTGCVTFDAESSGTARKNLRCKKRGALGKISKLKNPSCCNVSELIKGK